VEHRGLAPENTLKSIAKAIEHGVDEIEIDARVTADNVVVLHHDENLVDASGNKLTIRKTKYDELLKHKNDLAKLDEAIV
jgi:glycerophosphoryl diester phosphodiesterase